MYAISLAQEFVPSRERQEQDAPLHTLLARDLNHLLAKTVLLVNCRPAAPGSKRQHDGQPVESALEQVGRHWRVRYNPRQ